MDGPPGGHSCPQILLANKAQEITPAVLNELRLFTRDKFDSRSLLSVVLARDARLNTKLMREDLLPLSSRIRIRIRLPIEPSDRDTLVRLLVHLVTEAGNVNLMTPELVQTLAEHAMGKPAHPVCHGSKAVGRCGSSGDLDTGRETPS